MNLAHILARSARSFPERPAVLVGDRCVHTYAGLAARSARLAGYLRQNLGLAPGERVAIFMSNCPEYLECLYGVLWAGLVAVPINAKLHAREAAWIVGNAEARLVCVSADLAGVLAPALEEADSPLPLLVPGDGHYTRAVSALAIPVQERAPDALAWLFYTSGTTGQPKGVMLSHRNLQAMTSCFFMDVDPVAAGDAAVYAAPLSHGAGLYSFPYVLRGCRHVIPESGGFEPDELIGLSQRVGRLAMFAAPTMVRRLVDRVKRLAADPSGFQTLIYGGGPMYGDDIQAALEAMGPRFVQIYGQGESPMTITASEFLPGNLVRARGHGVQPSAGERVLRAVRGEHGALRLVGALADDDVHAPREEQGRGAEGQLAAVERDRCVHLAGAQGHRAAVGPRARERGHGSGRPGGVGRGLGDAVERVTAAPVEDLVVDLARQRRGHRQERQVGERIVLEEDRSEERQLRQAGDVPGLERHDALTGRICP